MTDFIAATKAMSLSLRLLRKEKTIEDAFRKDHGFKEVEAKNGRLFLEQNPAHTPSWAKFIGEFSQTTLQQLYNQSCSAILFLEIKIVDSPDTLPRTMTLSFGGGFHALDLNAFERNFGLRVALNSISRENLRNVDTATLDATVFQRRIQSSRKADLSGFGIDVRRDLLRLAGGIPSDSSFARSLAGKDALTLHTQTSSQDVIEKCSRALKLFEATDYQKDYRFVDYIMPVLELDRIDYLDNLAFAEIKSLVGGSPSDLHLCLPDIIGPDDAYEIGYFGSRLKSGPKNAYTEVAIEDYVKELQEGEFAEIEEMAELKNGHEIYVVEDGKRDKAHHRRLYDCIVFEVVDDDKTYVLFAGEWFLVNNEFYAEIEQYFQSILASDPFIEGTIASNEQELIAELDGDQGLLNLDQARLSPMGVDAAKIEPCDFLSKSKQLIHLKDGHSSKPISHLWNQGLVSIEAFASDEQFRKEFRKEAGKRQKKHNKSGFDSLLPDGRSKPVASEYTVIFGIMRSPYKKTGKLGLPFFSKVSLRTVAERIQLMSYGVEVHLIKKI